MNKLQKENNQEYDFVLKSYKKLVNGFILKQKETEEVKFVGGIPINLKKESVKDLFDRSYKYNDYKYTTTPKVDGSRFLLFITESSPASNNKTFYFIDRALDIYNLVSKEGVKLKAVNLPKMLIDGEMVFSDGTGFSHYLPQSKTKYLCYMVFDILFGPSDIYINDALMDKEPKYKEAVSMSGVIGSKIWDYNMRYNVLTKLLVPSAENNNYPGLSMPVATSSFFRIELKQILQIKYMGTTSTPETFIYREFESNRRKFYTFLNTQPFSDNKMKNINNFMMKSKLSYDGIIFNPIDTGYIIGNWVDYKNTQYKWKPSNEQTADFSIKNTGRKINTKESSLSMKVVELYYRKFDQNKQEDVLVPFMIKQFQYYGLIPDNITVPDNSVCEFSYSPNTKYFIFQRVREAKGPNGFLVINSVIELTTSPIELKVIGDFFSNTKDNDTLVKIASYLTDKQKNKLLICANKIEFLTDAQTTEMVKFIKILNKQEFNEFKLTLTPNVKVGTYKNHIRMFEILNWKVEMINYIELLKNDIVTTYRYLNEIKDLVRISTDKIVNKTSFKLNYKSIIDADIDVSVIEKVDDINHNLPDDTDTKIRYENTCFYDPNGVLKINIIRKWTITEFDVLDIPKTQPVYEVVIESLEKNKLNITSLKNFLKFYLNF